MIEMKRALGSLEPGDTADLGRAAEARLVQKGLADWAEAVSEAGAKAEEAAGGVKALTHAAADAGLMALTKAELADRARDMGLDPSGMTKAQIAGAIRGAS